jgi:hypothetical protein
MNMIFKSTLSLVAASVILVSCAGNSINLSEKQKEGSTKIDHRIWNTLLQKNVNEEGWVNYEGFISDSIELNKYTAILSATEPNKLSDKERFVFWINTYNAFTVDLIVRNYPVESIKDIGGNVPLVNKVWGMDLPIKVNGKTYSLSDIEKKELLNKLFDPRIHFAINCASYSCPKLLNEAFASDRIEEQLNKQAGYFVNNPIKNEIGTESAELSKIFLWYRFDFTKDMSLEEYINQYSDVKVTKDTKFSYKEYVWTLNKQQ